MAALVGTLALLALPAIPPHAPAAAALLAACALGLRRMPSLAMPLACGALAFLSAAFHAGDQLARRWAVESRGERALVVASIDSIPLADEIGWRFDASVRVLRPARGTTSRMRITWPYGATRPRAGEAWQLLVSAGPPHARSNPHGPDGERQLFRERIHAFGRVVESRLNQHLSGGTAPLDALRERIVDRITAHVRDRDAAALIAALAVGHTGGMSREQWRVFNATGTTHLVAISGLHVTLFAMLAIGAARLLWRVLPPTPRLPRETFAAVLGLCAAAGYSLLAGFSVPTQRTLLMLGAWYAARATLRHAPHTQPLAVALLLVLALDPLAVLASGFWLSFLAMAAIIVSTTPSGRSEGRVREALRVQVAVALVLAPATVAWFGSVSLVGVAVNLLAIPLIGFVFVPLVLVAVASMPFAALADRLLDLACAMHSVFWPALSRAADAPHALVFTAPEQGWFLAAAMVAFLAVLPAPRTVRVAGVVWLLLLARPAQGPPPGMLDVVLLDTGEHVAAVVRSVDDVLVYGIGEGFGTRGRSVENALLPYLRATGAERISLLVLPRTRHDVSKGLNALLANIQVDRVEYADEWVVGCVRLTRDGLTVRGQARALTTATSGAISLRISAEGVSWAREQRLERRRLWSASPGASRGPGRGRGRGADPVSSSRHSLAGVRLKMWEIVRAGGPIMWPIILCSIVAAAIILERLWTLQEKRVLPAELVQKLWGLVESNQINDKVIAALEQNSPLGKVLAAGLAYRNRPRDVMMERLEDAGRHVVHELERFLNTLGTIAGISPLLGLLGTVTGIIKAFNAIQAGGMGDPRALSGGIAEALITTAAGLIVAIPALFAYRYLRGKVERFVIAMEKHAIRLADAVENAAHRAPDSVRAA